MEIGSNTLDEQGMSELSKLMPKHHLDHLTYSDYLQSIVEEEACKTKRPYKCVDIKNPEQAIYGSQDCLVAVNVADVITRQDLPKVASEAYNVLTNRGKVIILAQRPLDETSFFAKFSNPRDVVFRGISMDSGCVEGLNLLTADKLKQILKPWGARYISFINKLTRCANFIRSA